MRTLVVLAVMVAAAARQADSSPLYGYGYSQPPYVGPLASSIPAGVDGKIIPVSDTYEVAAARDKFFRAYQDQLNTIYAIRASRGHLYGDPGYGSSDYGHGPAVYHANTYHANPVHVTHSVHKPAVSVSHTVHKPAVSHSVHKPAVTVSHTVHKPAVAVGHAYSPAVHLSHPIHKVHPGY